MAALRAQLTIVKIYGCIGGNHLLKKITLNKEESNQLFVWKFTTLFKVKAFEYLTAFFVSKCFDSHSNISRKLQKPADRPNVFYKYLSDALTTQLSIKIVKMINYSYVLHSLGTKPYRPTLTANT
jgi:hypothetical protein